MVRVEKEKGALIMKNLIGNDWKDSSNLNVNEVFNPATGGLIDTVPDSTVDDVVSVVNLAKGAQSKWENTSFRQRGQMLIKFVKIIRENEEELANVLSEESGKVLKESLEELDTLCDTTLSFVETAKHLHGSTIQEGLTNDEDNSIQFTRREAIGVVSVIFPAIFKLDLFAKRVVSALIMGNAVVVKPSKKTPLTITKLVYMLRQAGVYESVVQVIHGDGKTVGQALAMHPDVNVVTFDGSTANGIKVMGNASKNLSKTILGLGGNNAFIVCKDADVDFAVNEAARSRFYNAGQLNTANKRFLVHKDLKEEFINKLIRRIGSIKLGLPTDKDADFGCLISDKAADKVEKQVKELIASGAKLVIGGGKSGAFYEPTIISEVTSDMKVATNLDILGPVVPIIEFESINDAIELVNSSAYGNATSVFTKSTKMAMKVATLVKNSTVVVNGNSLDVSNEIDSEGWKYSGVGHDGTIATLKEMSREKVIVLNDILD